MTTDPGVLELLDAARRALEGQVAGGAPHDGRETVKMAAAAIAIAVRELDAAAAPLDRQLELLVALYGEETVHMAGEDPGSRCAAMVRVLARDIRLGVLDGACAPAVRLFLDEHLWARLAVNEPAALGGTETCAR